VRVGIVGYGLAGAVFHAPLVAATPGLALAAVVTRDPERQARARREHPDVAVLDGPEALWAPGSGIDLVVVASPNATHAPLATAAIAAGRHVVVDKPFAVTAAEGERLVAAARAAGVIVVPYHNRRWDGDFRTVRRLVADGALGPVARFESRFDRWRPVPRAGWKEAGEPGAGTGLLYDLGSHLVDQALVLLGPVTHVYAERDRRRPGDPRVDDDVFLALTHASGARSHLWASALAAQPGPRFRVMGARAAYVKWGLDPQEAALGAGARPGDAGWGEEPPARWGTLGIAGADGDDAPRPLPTERGAYEQFYAGVLAAVRAGAPPPVDPADAVAGLRVLEAATRSAADGRVVRPEG
jgi:predicted dehydrogenase